MKSFWHAVLLGGCFVVISGCSGDGLYPVTGIVTLDGQPVEGASVMFMASSGPPAAGKTDAQGRYTLQTLDREGAVVGVHQVTILKCESVGPLPPEGGAQSRPTKWHVPQRYSDRDTSDLTADVAQEDNKYDFTLTSK